MFQTFFTTHSCVVHHLVIDCWECLDTIRTLNIYVPYSTLYCFQVCISIILQSAQTLCTNKWTTLSLNIHAIEWVRCAFICANAILYVVVEFFYWPYTYVVRMYVCATKFSFIIWVSMDANAIDTFLNGHVKFEWCDLHFEIGGNVWLLLFFFFDQLLISSICNNNYKLAEESSK